MPKSKANKGINKRTLSNSSPDNTVKLPEKSAKCSDKTPPLSTSSPITNCTQMSSPCYAQPMNMANMSNMASYQTPAGSFYTTPPAQTIHPTQFINQPPIPLSPAQTTCAGATENFQQYIIDKLNSMDKRLCKLDTIESQLTDLSRKINQIDNRVISLEASSREANSRLTEIETSKAVESEVFDDIISKQSNIDKLLKEERDRVNQLQRECDQLKSINEDVVDLQARSMRDNLLFFGFAEPPSAEERRSENCTQTFHKYCEKELNIPDASSAIKIERAHRIGRYDSSKPRPIVVKFNHYPDKLLVKQKCSDLQRNSETRSQIRVSEQFPKLIQDKRRQLIPVLIKAKQDGKTAYLSYDKLFINNKMFTVDTLPQSGYC